MRISDWSSDVCSSDLIRDIAAGCVDQERAPPHVPDLRLPDHAGGARGLRNVERDGVAVRQQFRERFDRHRVAERQLVGMVEVAHAHPETLGDERSEEHTSELQSLMRISYAVFCLKK